MIFSNKTIVTPGATHFHSYLGFFWIFFNFAKHLSKPICTKVMHLALLSAPIYVCTLCILYLPYFVMGCFTSQLIYFLFDY